MSNMSEIAAALERWEDADTGRPAELVAAGNDLAAIVRELAGEPESYTDHGLPRRAASRARAAGAKITYTAQGIRVDFPNGSWVVQHPSWTRRSRWGVLTRHRGAVPGCLPPPGDHLEAVLQSFTLGRS